MDHYLSIDNCYQRLEDEFKKYGKLIFCVDFDDTLYDFHKLGRKYDDVIDLLHRWEDYSEVIILTGNGEDKHDMIKAYLDEKKIKYAGINCDSSVAVGGRKTYGNVYIDDRGGLPLVYDMLITLIGRIEDKQVVHQTTEYDKYMKRFDAVKVKNDIVKWIREWFSENGDGCNAVVGISGGKDSSVVAALCAEALGKDRVLGVLMPNHTQTDISFSYQLCDHLGIPHTVVSIGHANDAITSWINSRVIKVGDTELETKLVMSEQARVNLPSRIRMATLYAVSQSVNGRVANTCNLSEDWIGYSTRYGDSVGDFSPLSKLTSDEVIAVGKACGLPKDLVEKVPSDGLCGKTDEDNFGFTYRALNEYIRTGVCNDEKVKNLIDTKHEKNLFKLMPMPVFEYTPMN